MDTQISGRPPTAEIPWSAAAPPPPPPRRSRLRTALAAAAAVVLVAGAVVAFLALRGNGGSRGNTNATVATAAPGGATRVRLRVPDRIADFVRQPASSLGMTPYYVMESYAREGTAAAGTFVLGVTSYRSDDEAARAVPSRIESLRSSNPAVAPAVTVSSDGVDYAYVVVPSAPQSAPMTMYFWRAGSVLFTVTAGRLDQATVLALAPQAQAAVLPG